MSEQNLGNILREQREKLAFSLDDVARMTNIRSRMLATFESGDYAGLPDYGHSKGMLLSYLHALNLDPYELLRIFDREYIEFQNQAEMQSAVHHLREERGKSGNLTFNKAQPRVRHDIEDISAQDSFKESSLQSEQAARKDNRYKSGSVRVVSHRATSNAIPSRITRSSDRRSQTKNSALRHGARQSLSTRGQRSRHHRYQTKTNATSGTINAKEPLLDEKQTTKADEINNATFHDEKAPRSSRRTRHLNRNRAHEHQEEPKNIFQRLRRTIIAMLSDHRTRLIFIAAVLFALGVIILASFLISSAGNANSGIHSVEGGAQDTTVIDTDSKTASATITTINGSPVDIKISVAEDETSLVNISYDDNKVYNATVVGYWEREFQVTKSMTATFGNPDAITVMQDDNEIELEKNKDGTGTLSLEVNSTSSIEESSSNSKSSSKD